MTLQNTLRIAAEVRAVAARHQSRYADLAPVLNVSKPGISRRMRGEQSFTAEEMQTLATHFGVPVGVLYGEPAVSQAPADAVPLGIADAGAFLHSSAAA